MRKKTEIQKKLERDKERGEKKTKRKIQRERKRVKKLLRFWRVQMWESCILVSVRHSVRKDGFCFCFLFQSVFLHFSISFSKFQHFCLSMSLFLFRSFFHLHFVQELCVSWNRERPEGISFSFLFLPKKIKKFVSICSGVFVFWRNRRVGCEASAKLDKQDKVDQLDKEKKKKKNISFLFFVV